jgi:hypothetical protein
MYIGEQHFQRRHRQRYVAIVAEKMPAGKKHEALVALNFCRDKLFSVRIGLLSSPWV